MTLGPISLVDLFFIVTVVLLVFNGLRNGFVFSLVNLLSLPMAIAVAWMFGPQLTQTLAANNLPSTPIIAYLLLFFGTVLIIHILATTLRGIIRKLPVVGAVVGLGDTLLGAVVGFVEAWLLWVAVLFVLQHVLQSAGNLPAGIPSAQLSGWQAFYDQAITASIFAKVNSFIIGTIHR